MDFLDICNGRYNQTHTGRYFKQLPHNAYVPDGEGIYDIDATTAVDVDYEYVDPTSWHYKTLLSNLIETEAANATIKTREPIKYSAKSYFLLDNGRLCRILSVTEDTASAQREAARLLPIPVGTEYVIRLVEVENPWGL